MKRYLSIIIIAFLCQKLSAQFYSIGYRRTSDLNIRQAETTDTAIIEKSYVQYIDSLKNVFLSVSPPLDNIVITSRYGMRKDPITGKRSQHSGLDLKADHSTVYAMLDGEVIKTGRDKRSGLFLTIRSGYYEISFCHLSRLLTMKGRQVRSGEAVAVSGNSGRSTGPHLHITCRKDGKVTDPLVLLRRIETIRNDAIERIRYAAGRADSIP